MTKDEFIDKWGYDIEQSGKEIEMQDDLTLLLNQHLHDFIMYLETKSDRIIDIPNSDIGRFNMLCNHKTK